MNRTCYIFISLTLILVSLLVSCRKNYSFENYYYGSPPSIIRPEGINRHDF